MFDCCNESICSRCLGGKKVITGVLLLLNAFIWPRWLGIDGWISFLAVLIVIAGVMKLLMPMCPHCRGMMMGKMMKGKK
ncbi:MAG: hypothetical protein Q8R37_00260 [Nanoarchaeota archaeon]|nr:hypothetical protein [Nanoarchaeota archaeon]